MAGNITFHGSGDLLISAIGGMLREIRNLAVMDIFLVIIVISLVIHTLSFRKWFDDSAKNETLTKMVLTLQHGNEKLADKLQAMEKSYDKLLERVLNLESHLHAEQIINKEDKADLRNKLKSLETYVNEENKKHTGLMKALEALTIKEVKTLQEATTHRFQALEELVNDQTETEEVVKKSTSVVPHKTRGLNSGWY